MTDRLKALYKSQILKQAQNPENFGELSEATHVLEAYNPMCGDQYQLFLQVEGEKVIAAAFKGNGCAISKASTAVLVKRIIGEKLSNSQQLVSLFLSLIDPDSDQPIDEITDDEELLAFAATRQHPEREQCASLAWTELANFIDQPGKE